MSFLTPLYLLGALAITLPIVLHFLRRDVAPQVPFTAVRLLRGTPLDRSRRRRLRDILLLAARVAALLLLAASFARPFFAGATGHSGATVVAIDRSFSMGAPGVFARAVALARAEIDDAARRGDRVALVAFDDRAVVTSPLGPAADARVALGGLSPGSGATRYAVVADKGADLLRDEAQARLVLVGDLQRSGFDGAIPMLPRTIDLVVRSAGGAEANLALTDVRVAGGRRVATIHNYGGMPATVQVRLEGDGRGVASQTVTVGGGAATDVTFDAAPAGAIRFTASIDDPTGYQADNRRFALVRPATPPRVLIAGGGSVAAAGFFLSRALEAGDGAPDFDVKIATGSALAAMSAADLEQQSVVALLSTHGLDRRVKDTLRAFLDAGGGLLIAAAPDMDASVLSALLDWQPVLAPTNAMNAGVLAVNDGRHPIFRPFEGLSANLSQVAFQRAWGVTPGKDWRVLATFSDGTAALLERAAGPGRILLFTSDLDRRWNDFPLHPSFVPFAQEVVRYLGARSGPPVSVSVADVPAGIAPEPGIVTTAGRTIAVNVDARESSVDRMSAAEFETLVTRSAAPSLPAMERLAQQAEARQGYWRYGLLLMIGVLVAEAFVGSR